MKLERQLDNVDCCFARQHSGIDSSNDSELAIETYPADSPEHPPNPKSYQPSTLRVIEREHTATCILDRVSRALVFLYFLTLGPHSASLVRPFSHLNLFPTTYLPMHITCTHRKDSWPMFLRSRGLQYQPRNDPMTEPRLFLGSKFFGNI